MPASHENCGGCLKFWRKIQAENSGGKLLRKIPAESSGGKLRRTHRIYAPGKIQAYDGTFADVEISAPRKISAPSQNVSGKVWRPLTIWARQNLSLLTSSWSGWRALVQILVDVLILRHVDLKWSEGSGRSAFMGGVSPVLYRLVVPARPVEISSDVQNSCGRANFHHFLWKLKNSISAPKCPITAPKIHTWSLLLSKFSYHTHRLLMEAVLDFGRGCRDLSIILLGECVGEGGAEMGA